MPSFFASATSRSNSASVPSSGLIASWPPSSEPIAHGLPGSFGPAVERVVPALAVRAADRVDRRQVDDVEAELGELRQERAHALEAAPRAREELVPGAEARERPVDVDLVGLRPRLAGAVARQAPRAPPRRSAPRRRAARRPPRARSRDPSGRASTLRRSSSWNDAIAVDPRLDAVAPRAAAVDGERPRPLVVAERLERRLLPAGRARRLVADRGAELLVAVAEDGGGHVDAVALGPLHRDSGRSRPAASRAGSGSAAGGSFVFGRGTMLWSFDDLRESNACTCNGRPASSCIRPRFRAVVLDDDAYRFVDWLEAAGQSWWQVLPLGPPDEFGSPYRADLRIRGLAAACSPSPARRSRRRRSRTSSRAIRTGSATGRASPEPGAIADQVRFEREWNALRDVRARPRHPADRRRPDLRLRRRRRRRGVARALRARRGRGRAARRAERERPALGQPALRLARAPRDRLPLVDRALPARRSSSSTSRAIDHFRGFVSYWAVPEKHKTARHGHWRRGPGARALPRGRAARSASLAGDRGGPRRDHARRSTALRDELGLPGMAVLHWAFGRARVEPARTGEPSREPGRLHEHARHRHDRRLVRVADDEGEGAHRPRSGRAALGPDRDRAAVAARRSRSCRRRTCSASAARRG